MGKKIGNIIILIGFFVLVLYYFLDVQILPNDEEWLIVEVLYWFIVVLLAVETSRTIYKLMCEKEKEGHDNYWDSE